MLKMAGQSSPHVQEEIKEYVTQSGLEVSGLIVKFGEKDVLLRWDAGKSRFVVAHSNEFDFSEGAP